MFKEKEQEKRMKMNSCVASDLVCEGLEEEAVEVGPEC